jgi:hypothetical protein
MSLDMGDLRIESGLLASRGVYCKLLMYTFRQLFSQTSSHSGFGRLQPIEAPKVAGLVRVLGGVRGSQFLYLD